MYTTKLIRGGGSQLLFGCRKARKCFISGDTAVCLNSDKVVSYRKMSSKVVSMETINPHIPNVEYAVRGELVIRANELEAEMLKGAKKPFKEIIKANIGDAHAMGQVPITWIRQVLACVTHPQIMESGDFPADVKQRARELLNSCGGGSVGAYSQSQGVEYIRKHCAEYIERRDGFPSDWRNVCLSGGASEAIKNVLKLFINHFDGKPTGIMIPIPQYPLYSAALSEYGIQQCGYYLDEDTNWGIDLKEMQRVYQESSKTAAVRAVVVINPGNPTGQVLTDENIRQIIKFAHMNKLFIFADEVYQDNVYDPNSQFHSFKKILMEMGEPYTRDVELASFMSASKGYMGECGLRGGYAEVYNMDAEVQAQLYKLISASLCSTVLGQVVIDCIVCPPKPGDPSYAQWLKEKQDTLDGLRERAQMVYEAFNSMEGFKCNKIQGAMYGFPRVFFPEKAIKKAKEMGKTPDTFYALQLLESTGICVVPGSGFHQYPDTYHFRTTILPQKDKLKTMLNAFRDFHIQFMKQYS